MGTDGRDMRTDMGAKWGQTETEMGTDKTWDTHIDEAILQSRLMGLGGAFKVSDHDLSGVMCLETLI